MRVEKPSLRNFSGELRMSQLVNDRKRTQSYCRNVCPPRNLVTSLTFYLAITSCHVPQIKGDSVKYSWEAARKKILCCSKLSLSILLPVCLSLLLMAFRKPNKTILSGEEDTNSQTFFFWTDEEQCLSLGTLTWKLLEFQVFQYWEGFTKVI